MTIATIAKNQALDGVVLDTISLHSAFPGTLGVNKISGGTPAYADQAAVFNAASGGSRLLNAPVVFDVPACTVAWLGFSGGGVFKFAVPNGGATPKNFMAVPASDLVYATGHGWLDDQKIVFFGGPPAPLVEGTTYFVRDAATDSFKVTDAIGNDAIDLTTASSAGAWVVAITEQTYAGQDTHTVSAGTVTVPD